MILVQIAAYLLFITLILYFAIRLLWIVFFLFAYRFWEAILTKNMLEHALHSNLGFDYNIIILVITAATYAIVMISTRKVGFLKYVFLLLMALLVFRKYSFYDIFFFRDYLQAHGMWSLNYWVEQAKELFTGNASDKQSVFESVWNSIIGFIKRCFGYANELGK